MSDVKAAPTFLAGGGLERLIAALETTPSANDVIHLREAVSTRQRLGVVTGLVAERYGLPPDEAWSCLVGLSQLTNVKGREVGRIVYDGFCGQLAAEDRALAARLNDLAPRGRGCLIDLARQPPAR